MSLARVAQTRRSLIHEDCRDGLRRPSAFAASLASSCSDASDNRKGATALEYALIGSLVFLVALAGMTALGHAINSM